MRLLSATEQTTKLAEPHLHEKKWGSFTRWLSTHSTPAQRRLLQTLHEHDKALSVYDLSAWSGIARCA